jgi:hypothetical protein
VKAATAKVDAVAAKVEARELIKFPRPEGKPLAESEAALKLPGNLPAVLAKVEPKKRGVDALLEAVPYFASTPIRNTPRSCKHSSTRCASGSPHQVASRK